jgi:membrane protease YdiL (CAAX protease family)
MTDQPPTAPPAPSRRDGRAVRDPGGPLAARIAWVVIVGVVALIAVAPMIAPLPGPTTPIEAPAGEQEVESGTGRAHDAATADAGDEADRPPPPGIFGEALKPIVLNREGARGELKMAGSMFVRGPPDRIRIAIIAGDAIGPEAALEHLAKLDPEKLTRGERRDVQILETLYRDGPHAISAAAGERLADRYDWFGRLALTRGEKGPERDELLADARRVQITVYAFNGLLVGALIVGVGLFIAAITLRLMGRLRPSYAAPAAGGSAYLEMFAVFLAGYLVVSVAIESLAPAIGPWHHLLRWVMLAVVAWPLVRGAPWRQARFALGWHTGRGALREIALGIVGYIACLPIVGIGLACTLALMGIWGVITGPGDEEGAAPSHPIGDMLAQAGPVEIAMLLMVGVLWAPVVEETVFRGAFYHHLRGRLGAIGAGLATGFVFAAIHPQGIFAIPVLTSVGFVFCLLREWRGTLLAPIAAHALNNGVILTVMLLVML